MSSERIYEFAKELDKTSTDLLEICSVLGIYIKSHSAMVTSAQKKRILAYIKEEEKKKKEEAARKSIEKKEKKEADAKKVEVKKKASKPVKKEKEPEHTVVTEKQKTSVKTEKTVEPEEKTIKAVKDKSIEKAPEVTETEIKTPEVEIEIEQIETDEFEEVEEEKYIKKVKGHWDEEKKINIRKVLDKELDKEEKEGRFRARVKPSTSKKIKINKKLVVSEKGVSEEGTDEARPVEEKVSKRSEIKKLIELPEGMTIKQLSERINIPSTEIMQVFFNMGEMMNINQVLDKDLIELLSQEFNFKYSIIGFEDENVESFDDQEKDLVQRPPIVTIMGHVDHGKTTLLDTVRKSNVVSSEAGGITQRIGAYQAVYKDRKITFLDTPGHEAFTAMRARGARVTDIAVIIVAADDGIMPQTAEAINHAKDAGVPIIVAINKIDLPNINPDKIKQGLTEYNLVPEEWGGDTIFVNISAKSNTNIEELLEMVLLVADMNDIKGNPKAEGSGIIIESRLDKGFGPVGTVLVKRGNIKVGDFFATGNSYGRVRTIRDEKDNNLKRAELSQPVEISGFTTLPQAGDRFFIVKNEKVAKDIINRREHQKRLLMVSEAKKHVTLEDLSEISKESEIKKLKIILKAESNGSLDAVEKSLKDLDEENIKIEFIHKAVGAISDGDVLLAAASDAIILGFGVVPSPKARNLAKDEGIEVRTYEIIYKLIDDIKLAFKGMLEPKYEEKIKGTIEIRELFKITKVGNIAGCYILEGEVERGSTARVIRDGKIIYDGKISSLHRFKEDVKKVSAGYECGIKIENFQDLSKGDILEVYEQEEVKE